MMNWLHQLPRYWQGTHALTFLLWPIELLYRGLFGLRQFLYGLGVFKQHRVNATVIVVGNVVAGGGGKTPLSIALVQRLKQQGYQVGVISRGYGRKDQGLQSVTPNSDVAVVGDEPLLMAQKCKVPIMVGTNRVEAAQALLKQFPAVNVIVCDDGLQHLRLQRDIEICVMDAAGLGNGHLLPAGPLREPWPRKVDLLLHTQKRTLSQGYDSTRQIIQAVNQQGQNQDLSQLAQQAVEVVCGIAKPQAFVDMLEQQQIRVERLSTLPDHDDFSQWRPLAPHLPLLCTEKDAVKLWTQQPQAWAVQLEFQPENAFWVDFDKLMKARHRYH
jgi:tetraacyldisaccharide 4'-kinase